MEIKQLTPAHYDAVIALGNLVHGDNYLDLESIKLIHQKSIKNNINASFIATEGEQLLGFRLTYAPQNWQTDKWCSCDLWQVPVDKTCYFKCNTVTETARGKGIGGLLLKASIEAVKKQGGIAGASHIWLQSPGNSAFRYFTKAGGELIKIHPDRWLCDSLEHGYVCSLCGNECHCEAAEMLLKF
ncbi:GNAT family N-acetyltransferase [Pseudoalteromonas denitrificans]|uniref:Acetyltransferase (GNAT) family protein n=1 Tax=Pseudoalteromonas denitrificans DSM 6059 TaxID=1123010 RepID=A0A1I1J0U4_9GAMM|nr:GNAT family N-acetyltransferase [Pseudoalteromonas denitrificans]SFC41612.1 Acetyltransferase (GNAT) family protein [Pseudoalteromonas denitrificans DSM 6059]